VSTTDTPELRHGFASLRAGKWEAARFHFEKDLALQCTAEGFEGLAAAQFWLDEGAAALQARKRAYLLYRRSKDSRAAARIAIHIAWDFLTLQGNLALADEWLNRSGRLLEPFPDCPERGWLLAYRAASALVFHNDVDAALALAQEAGRLGRLVLSTDLELVSRSIQGLATISRGEVDDGLRLLDDVLDAFAAGRMSDRLAMAQSACNVILGCERIRDYDRAAECCRHFQEFSAEVHNRTLVALCRTQYAEVLMWHGNWREAESEFSAAWCEFDSCRPGLAPAAVVGLARLRMRQGKRKEAAELIRLVEHFTIARSAVAEFCLACHDPATAVAACEQSLRELPENNWIARAGFLELLLRAHVQARDLAAAQQTLSNLETVVRRVGTEPLEALLSLAKGLVAALAEDHSRAREYFEDAIEHYSQCRASFETALSRIELAQTLLAMRRHFAAVRSAERAIEELRRIGADEAERRAWTIIESANARLMAASGV
jgi:tetratricopeptide (TPR) repeat protein